MHASTPLLPLIYAATVLLLGDNAQAQVQKCQVDGRLVFQSGPCPAAPTAVTSNAMPIAPVTGAPKKRGLADLLRQRDAEDRARPSAQEVQQDGANVLPARMGAV